MQLYKNCQFLTIFRENVLTYSRVYIIIVIVVKANRLWRILRLLKGRIDEMEYFKIMYIGNGYEVVYEDTVYAVTYDQALELAEKNYYENNWTFHYCFIEAEMQ